MNGWNLQVLTNYPKTALKLSGKENITIWTIKIWIKIKIKICGYLSKYFFFDWVYSDSDLISKL